MSEVVIATMVAPAAPAVPRDKMEPEVLIMDKLEVSTTHGDMLRLPAQPGGELQTHSPTGVGQIVSPKVMASNMSAKCMDENDLTAVVISSAPVGVTSNVPQWLPQNVEDLNTEDKDEDLPSRIDYGDMTLPWEMPAHSNGCGINTILYEYWRFRWKKYYLSCDMKSDLITLSNIMP